MNMNHEPIWAQETTERNPMPRWARWLAAALVLVGYGLLEAHDAATERAIAAAERPKTHVADATP